MIDVHTYNNSGSLENMKIMNLNSYKYQIKIKERGPQISAIQRTA